MIHAIVAAALLALVATSGPPALEPVPEADHHTANARSQGESSGSLFFLVRHCEAEAEGDDPPLEAEGRTRAEALARALGGAGVERVLSTDFRRTRQTAAPIAAAMGVEVEIYDHRDLAGLADRLGDAAGRVLIVGHSNTTPAVVELLGGEPGPPIAHAEHDRLYVVALPASGGEGAVSALLRFGAD